MNQNSNQTTERWGIRYTGIVQGVGFRPLVSMLAHSLGLTGFVYNDSQGVYVEIQGFLGELQLFLDAVQEEQPRLCRITSQTVQHLTLNMHESDFVMIALKSYNKINVERNILSSTVQIADQGIRLSNLCPMIGSGRR